MEKKTTISRWRKSGRHHHLAFCASSSVVRRPSSVRSKLCAVIQSQRFCARKILHICTSLSSRGEKKMASRSSFFVHHKRRKKTERAFFHRAAKNALFFLVSLSFLCPFVKHPANDDETTFYTPKTHFLKILRSKFFFFFQNLARERKTTLFLSLSSLISLSRKRMMMMKTRTTRTTRRQSVREEGKKKKEEERRDDDEYRVSSPRAL